MKDVMTYRFFGICFALAFAASTASAAPPGDAERRQFRLAHHAALHAPPGTWRPLARGLEDYPLHAYLEYAALSRDLKTVVPADVKRFLERERGTLLEERLRDAWLAQLAEAKRWREYLAFHVPSESLERRCGYASARAETGDTAKLADDARALWRTGKSLPRSCDALLNWIRRQPWFDAPLVWERIELAAAERESGLIARLAPSTGPGRAEAARWSQAVLSPSAALARVQDWPDDARHRRLAALALAQLARADAARAAALWPAISARFRLDDAQRAQALNAIALYKAASYEPDAVKWITQVPVAKRSDEVREWAVREALARRDWAAVQAALDALSEAQRDDPRWRYVRARTLELAGRGAEAQPLFDALAREPNYHGFVAAERLGAPYAICPQDPAVAPPVAAAVAADASLVRAFELHALGWLPEARREWSFALREASPEERRAAVAAAHARGWVERGPLTLLKPDETRLYALRFPVAHEADIRAAAKRHGVDPAVVFALIRSESAWATDARSGANAYGLMQLLPGAAAPLAKKDRLPYRAPTDLFDPKLNVKLGTHHLRNDLNRYGGKLWLAAAAYNAGPSPVQRWMNARGMLPADLFVETIPYRETREYVSRVIAFSVIYDWRINGDAASLANRIAVASKGNARRPVACPATQGAAP